MPEERFFWKRELIRTVGRNCPGSLKLGNLQPRVSDLSIELLSLSFARLLIALGKNMHSRAHRERSRFLPDSVADQLLLKIQAEGGHLLLSSSDANCRRSLSLLQNNTSAGSEIGCVGRDQWSYIILDFRFLSGICTWSEPKHS